MLKKHEKNKKLGFCVKNNAENATFFGVFF